MVLSWVSSWNRYRVWMNEPSGAEYEPTSECFLRSFPARGTLQVAAQVTVETHTTACKPFYGLVGLQFTPGPGDTLSVAVREAEGLDRPFESLAGASDHVRVGLSKEYFDCVCDAICEELKEAPELPAGRLIVSAAAEGAIGSCVMTMTALARTAVVLVLRESLSDLEIRAVVESGLARPGTRA